MLCAYYDHSCDSRRLFADLEIANDPNFERHLNKYPVIYLDMTAFVSRFKDDSIVEQIQQKLKEDILKAYPQVQVRESDDLMETLLAIYAETSQQFIMIIDEWDAICREFTPGTSAMDKYVNWLRRMFKEVNAVNVFAAVYMTGILPIKKYKTESALNNFQEYSMVEPRRMSAFFGFTKDEARTLAAQHNMPFSELENVLTVLIHLGYLSYDWSKSECYIPNREVAGEMVNAVKANNWTHLSAAIEKSRLLLQATLDSDAEAVARGVDAAHDENTNILSYNDENSLACVLSIAYYYAKNDYVMHRELATGKGFADIVLIPRKNVDLPAMVIELKVNKDADSAIDQIRRKEYPAVKVQEYANRLLLVGINYDRETKQHLCRIDMSSC